MKIEQSKNLRKGVLLVNLGTPKSPHPTDVYHYLNEFLTDPRVMDIPWLKRQCLVRGLIVPSRYKQSAKQYQLLWQKEGSPLLYHGKQVQKKLQEALGDQYHIVLSMRYQEPSIVEGLAQLQSKPIDELIILPLFPQYASATTGSVYQKVMECLKNWNVFPKLKFINQFFDHPGFIDSICERAKQYDILSYDQLLFSFHGLPERQIQKTCSQERGLNEQCCEVRCIGNSCCYKAQCFATMRAIADKLNLDQENYSICFQSRLGKDPWIQPYFSDVLHECADKGHKRILVFSPSFICDCLETTYEISGEYSKEFKKLGGEDLHLVEGLNDHPLWIETLRQLILH